MLLANLAGMLHYVAWALKGTLLFRTWAEGVALVECFVAAFPELEALCAMPRHVHVQGEWPDGEQRLARAESGFARKRLAMRGGEGPVGVFARHPDPTPVVDVDHERRTRRYIFLNPLREGLVECPLAWPLSTYRDRVGLSAFPLCPPAKDPERLHAYVSLDADTRNAGTPFPQLRRRESTLDDVIDAVSACARVGASDLARGGAVRTLAVETAWLAGIRDVALLATVFDLHPRSVRRTVAALPESIFEPLSPRVEACLRVLGDSRFERLYEGDLVHRSDWVRLRGNR